MTGARTLDVLVEINRLIVAHGYSPSIREIGDAVGMKSTGTVARHILKLEQAGLVTQMPGQQRTLRLTMLGSHTLREAAEVRSRHGKSRASSRATIEDQQDEPVRVRLRPFDRSYNQ